MEKADTRLENKKGFSSKKPNYPNKNLKSDNRKGGRRKNILRLSKIKYEEKIIQVKRVTKVVKGGKKNDF